ncbi:unnamed protein product [Protopolystoma xenopodis]|uniref:Uncharacterized protein n=1 Tax=Protopolystoma xenopodis TaxID=117903 RepID=A0A448WNG3_9PLAT|nr:unnamed protein product [Protopolystoma xenopodis]
MWIPRIVVLLSRCYHSGELILLSRIQWAWLLSELFKEVGFSIDPSEEVVIVGFQNLKQRCQLIASYLQDEEKLKVLHDSNILHWIFESIPFMPKEAQQLFETFEEAMKGKSTLCTIPTHFCTIQLCNGIMLTEQQAPIFTKELQSTAFSDLSLFD